jgi:hypothetical protein
MFRLLPLGVLALSLALAPAPALAGAAAGQVVEPARLMTGASAAGQVGDWYLENDEIAIIVSAIGHVTGSGENGGTVIDAGPAGTRRDALGEFYTYFDDAWPRQAVYTDLTVVDDGSGGGPAAIRVVGHDSVDPLMHVVTDYSLAAGDRHLTVTTTITGGFATLWNFELGDAFQWGECAKYSPGYGYAVNGETVQRWIAGTAAGVSYAYGGPAGDHWGPHGAAWSDLNLVTVDLRPATDETYTRYLAVTGGDLAAAASILMDVLAIPTGRLYGNVLAEADAAPLAGAWVTAYDTDDLPYLQGTVNAVGQAVLDLPPGDYTIEAAGVGYLSRESPLTVYEGAMHVLDFSLEAGSGPSVAIGDTITVIQRPLVNVPAIVATGGVLTVHCAADPGATGWTVELVRGGSSTAVPLSGATYDAGTGWWTLAAPLPALPARGLHDLRVTAAGGIEDTARQAVQVLDRFRDDWYFVHITDPHLPDHRFSEDGAVPADSSEIVDLRAVIADLNVINPEFVLITGDFVNEGELEDHLEWRSFTRAQRMLYEFDVPTYLIAGNHDLGGWTGTPPPAGTARRDWWRFFGWPRLDDPPPGAPLRTQNYSFDYGPVHVAGLESYDNYDMWRPEIYGTESFIPEQLAWLDQDLAAAAGSVSRVLFYHFDFGRQLDLAARGVEMALWGHVHGDRGHLQEQPWDLATDNTCDGQRAYRVVRVTHGALRPEETVRAGSAGENLTVTWSPANDGTADEVTATVTNAHPLDFDNGRLRFVMPFNHGAFGVTGGTLVQTERQGAHEICVVAVDIPAAGSTAVTVARQLTDTPRGPTAHALHPGVPNPFNPSTRLRFDLAGSGRVSLRIHDLAGRRVRTLVDGEVLPAGAHERIWDGRDAAGRPVAAGTYLARITAGEWAAVTRLTLVK